MSNVLVFWEQENLKLTGGPSGYNYVLKQGLDKIGYKVNYLPQGSIFRSKKMTTNPIILTIRKLLGHYSLFFPYHSLKINLNSYDVIHFHTTMHLYKARKLLKNYSGIVILTSHSPQLLSEEYAQRVSPIIRKLMAFSFSCLRKMDSYAFNRADQITFPCEEAEEPYANWSIFQKAKKEGKIVYLLTGVDDKKKQLASKDFRKEYGISQDAFVISYVGRHNEVKGYTDLQKYAERVLDKYKNVYFLIGGKEEPFHGLKHDRWIEVGWTNQAADLISCSNLFVLPNRQTYFDLVLLEVLSLGIPILATNTGGNKYFKRVNHGGIQLYENDEDFYNKIDDILSKSINFMGQANRDLFETQFNETVFAERYIEMISYIAEGRGSKTNG